MKQLFRTTVGWIGVLLFSSMWTGCMDVEPFEADMLSDNASKRALKREVMAMDMIAEGSLTLPDLFKTWGGGEFRHLTLFGFG